MDPRGGNESGCELHPCACRKNRQREGSASQRVDQFRRRVELDGIAVKKARAWREPTREGRRKGMYRDCGGGFLGDLGHGGTGGGSP
uniref:Uncharacterized protein n=1 Tax=Oryza brachyantha TaxID=4533 RepID=J3N781_ORYBR